MGSLENTIKVPKRLKGFNDFFAKDMKIREFVTGTFKKIYEKYGYEPLETPTLEYAELMLGQSGSEAEKQFYRFTDSGGRDVMLKFEVMISMCRALAQNINATPLPYKRYQIQRVFRAENVQKGRYREFTQCDADTVGSSSMTCDAEFIQMGLEIVGEFGFKEYIARISNRKFLEGLAEYLGVRDDKFYGFFMSIDKIEKIGREGVINEMVTDRGIESKLAERALDIIDPSQFRTSTFRDTVAAFKNTAGSTQVGKEGLEELLQIAEYLETVAVNPSLYKFDTSIARGLASYTGPVWEFQIIEGGVGSIAGCGRYDKAIGKYLGKDVPATGGSFGIERICDIIKDRQMWDFGNTTVQVLVSVFDDSLAKISLETANSLRQNNISTMIYPEAVKLEKQLKYADQKGIPYVVIIGPDEVATNEVVLKNLKTKSQEKVLLTDLPGKIH
jgi:histidyl-tRNA synthetase